MVWTNIVVGAALLLFSAEAGAFNCGVTTTPVRFTNYDVFSPSPANSTGTINVSCNNPASKPIPVTIAISSGAAGSFNPRQMKAAAGAERLNYYLFTDPSRTVIWGDGTGGTSIVTNLVTKQATWIATVFGTVPPRQNLSAGSYSDTLTVTVLW